MHIHRKIKISAFEKLGSLSSAQDCAAVDYLSLSVTEYRRYVGNQNQDNPKSGYLY